MAAPDPAPTQVNGASKISEPGQPQSQKQPLRNGASPGVEQQNLLLTGKQEHCRLLSAHKAIHVSMD